MRAKLPNPATDARGARVTTVAAAAAAAVAPTSLFPPRRLLQLPVPLQPPPLPPSQSDLCAPLPRCYQAKVGEIAAADVACGAPQPHAYPAQPYGWPARPPYSQHASTVRCRAAGGGVRTAGVGAAAADLFAAAAVRASTTGLRPAGCNRPTTAYRAQRPAARRPAASLRTNRAADAALRAAACVQPADGGGSAALRSATRFRPATADVRPAAARRAATAWRRFSRLWPAPALQSVGQPSAPAEAASSSRLHCVAIATSRAIPSSPLMQPIPPAHM